jgi:antirestriction protein
MFPPSFLSVARRWAEGIARGLTLRVIQEKELEKMNTYHATPYDISASGFYFQTMEEYEEKAASHRNAHGDPVEEYEIQFIEGDDYALFNALDINQANLWDWFENFEGNFEGKDLVKALYLAIHIGKTIEDLDQKRLDDVMLFEGSAKDYAEQYLDDTGIFDAVEKVGLNPYYVDVDAFARDMELSGDVTTFEHGNNYYVVEYAG